MEEGLMSLGLRNKAVKVRGAGHCSLTSEPVQAGPQPADKAAAPHHSGPEPRSPPLPAPWAVQIGSIVCQVVDRGMQDRPGKGRVQSTISKREPPKSYHKINHPI